MKRNKEEAPSKSTADVSSPQPDTQDTDTFEILIKKIKALSKVNKEVEETIKSRMEEEVNIMEFQRVSKMKDVVMMWGGDGNCALRNDFIFGDKFDLTVRNFDDLCRLSKEMRDTGDDYSDYMRDAPKVRESLRRLLTNVETLQLLFGEIHSMIIAFEDTYNHITKLKKKMKEWSRVIVSNAGVPAVNGIYHLSGTFDKVGLYTKTATWEGRERTFLIRSGFNGCGWYIAICDPKKPGTSNYLNFYKAVIQYVSQKTPQPPENGWVTCEEYGLKPSPFLRVVNT